MPTSGVDAQKRARMVALDAAISEVAVKLDLSEGTVRNYLSTTILKVGARNRVEAARLAE